MNLTNRLTRIEQRVTTTAEPTNEQRMIHLDALRRAAERDPEARLRLDRAQRLLDRAAARLAEVKA
jgi:hypothetical protein